MSSSWLPSFVWSRAVRIGTRAFGIFAFTCQPDFGSVMAASNFSSTRACIWRRATGSACWSSSRRRMTTSKSLLLVAKPEAMLPNGMTSHSLPSGKTFSTKAFNALMHCTDLLLSCFPSFASQPLESQDFCGASGPQGGWAIGPANGPRPPRMGKFASGRLKSRGVAMEVAAVESACDVKSSAIVEKSSSDAGTPALAAPRPTSTGLRAALFESPDSSLVLASSLFCCAGASAVFD
mmetsp:Transcript_10790/g.24655  ORF Transcript_10790/g.24655 Transcript_10790/m.24655 type:complete len:236 (-) Transcript_10790:651-1358(-)